MTKIISLSDEAYGRLKRIKKEESFSKAILRLTDTRPKKTLLEVVRSWAPDEDLAENIEESYKKIRKFKLKRVDF